MTNTAAYEALEEIVDYLTGIPAWFLATIDESDATQPRVRPFSFAAAEQGKLWFSTSRDKDVYRELAHNPKFELSGWKPHLFRLETELLPVNQNSLSWNF